MRRPLRRHDGTLRLVLALTALYAALPAAHAEDTPLSRLMQYIEIDTINPPGNESRGVAFFERIFEAAGVDYETAESAPGRGNIWARIEGGPAPALLLLHHIDVVPATRDAWDTDPLEAVVRDGMLIGRGTLDTKTLGIMHLEAFLALHASGATPSRDVIFMATADEEAGGLYGAGWLVENRPELFRNVGYVLNEGGIGRQTEEHTHFGIEVAQKRPNWLRLVATDTPGHGSMPRTSSAATRLIAALNRIQNTPFEPRVVEPVREMFAALAPYTEPRWRDAFADVDTLVRDADRMAALQAEMPMMHALLRNTCSITMLEGSQKVNVVSPTAAAEIDCRILPDQDAEAFVEQIRARVADAQIEVDTTLAFSPAASSSDTPLYALLRERLERAYPGAGIVPSVSSGFTDSHFFRDLGIVSYGFVPLVVPLEDISGVHGNNERVSIASFEKGVVVMTDVVQRFAGTGAVIGR